MHFYELTTISGKKLCLNFAHVALVQPSILPNNKGGSYVVPNNGAALEVTDEYAKLSQTLCMHDALRY